MNKILLILTTLMFNNFLLADSGISKLPLRIQERIYIKTEQIARDYGTTLFFVIQDLKPFLKPNDYLVGENVMAVFKNWVYFLEGKLEVNDEVSFLEGRRDHTFSELVSTRESLRQLVVLIKDRGLTEDPSDFEKEFNKHIINKHVYSDEISFSIKAISRFYCNLDIHLDLTDTHARVTAKEHCD